MITRPIQDIVIHCAATPNGKRFHVGQIDAMHGQPVYDKKTGALIRQHQFERLPIWVTKFNPSLRHIGYHFYLDVDGSRAAGRHLDEMGAHVQGSNARSIGICMAGTNKFTSEQWLSLKWAVIDLARELAKSRLPPVVCSNSDQAMSVYGLLGVKVRGHRDFSPDLDGDGIVEKDEWVKECPGFDVADWIKAGMTALPSQIC
jgi:N-acetylmuramoyl-L-alanine amidase